jgi:hypothetical protein
MDDGHHNLADGRRYKHKAVWFEDDSGKSMTAYGNDYEFKPPYLVFHGCKGDIIFSPSVRVIIK